MTTKSDIEQPSSIVTTILPLDVEHLTTIFKTTTAAATKTTTTTVATTETTRTISATTNDKLTTERKMRHLEGVESSRANLIPDFSTESLTTTAATTSSTVPTSTRSATLYDMDPFLKFEDFDKDMKWPSAERDTFETDSSTIDMLSIVVPSVQKSKWRPAASESAQSIKNGRPTQSGADLTARIIKDDDVSFGSGLFIQDICTDDRLAVCATVGIVLVFLCAIGLYAVLYTAYQVYTSKIKLSSLLLLGIAKCE